MFGIVEIFCIEFIRKIVGGFKIIVEIIRAESVRRYIAFERTRNFYVFVEFTHVRLCERQFVGFFIVIFDNDGSSVDSKVLYFVYQVAYLRRKP